MKKLLLLSGIVAVLSLNSCSQEQVVEPQIASSKVANQEVPVLVTQAVSAVYPKPSTVDFSSFQTNILFVANVTTPATESQMVVSNKGILREMFVKIAKSELPAAVLAYLETNFPGSRFESAFKKVKGDKLGFRVELSFKNEKLAVFFDERGAFIELVKDLQNRPGKNGPAPVATEITLADLPAPVKSSISGYTFKRAMLIKDSSGKEIYYIRIDKLGVLYDLVIDSSGKILKTSTVNVGGALFTRVELKTLPAGLITFLKANAPGYTLNYAIAILKDAEIVEYHVGVNVGTKKLEFRLNTNFLPLQNYPSTPAGNKPPTLITKQVTSTDLPDNIKTYLNTNYAGWVLMRGVSSSVENVVREFSIMVQVGTKKYILSFDGKGSFLKAVLV